MRDYLYIWNDPFNQCIVTSGIEFRDICNHVGLSGGIMLLAHNAGYSSEYIKEDMQTNLEYIPHASIPDLSREDIYSWGDFCWIDYSGESFPAISDHEIAEVLFFRHMSKPLERITLPALNNKYLCYAHDDGWYMQLFYSSWDDVAVIVGTLYPQLSLEELRSGRTAYWLCGEAIETEEMTFDIDIILSHRH